MPTNVSSSLKGAYLGDLLGQPTALTDTIASLSSIPALPSRALSAERIVLTGMGASLHAVHPLRVSLVRSGRTAFVVETAELIHAQSALLDARTLVIAVSQSGRSAETVELLNIASRCASPPFIIGVTNGADSPLAQRAHAAIVIRAGSEHSVSCKTYVSTLAALEWLGGVLCGEDTAPILAELGLAAPAVKAYYADWQAKVDQLAGEFTSLRHLFLTGRGTSLAAVATGAIILKESTRIQAEGMSTPEFRHGLFELIGPGLYALVFAGEAAMVPLNESLVNDIRRMGGRAVLIGESTTPGPFRLPTLPERLRPMAEMLPVQLLSLALAALAGHVPGDFERAAKVTVVL
ncbi:MAG: SIS domain-containing protein [Opitutaceae bacterium]|nr:SIS domain-containing protein [Opitutaceae bacterium]